MATKKGAAAPKTKKAEPEVGTEPAERKPRLYSATCDLCPGWSSSPSEKKADAFEAFRLHAGALLGAPARSGDHKGRLVVT